MDLMQAEAVAPLVESGEVVDAWDLYDGDVIEHPDTGEVMTISAHIHLNPHYLWLMPGVIRFDVYDGLDVDGPLEWDGEPVKLTISEGMPIRRLFQYVLPPGGRIK
ncbi:hypothetical protein [Kineococcus xinjiangensis]|nr:hypothetical protein [Kineococcus xinjiangensis]